MRKKISVSQLRLGMFLDELCGSWLDHPFWKSAFLLSDPKQLAQIQESRVKEVWIDTRKGLDVAFAHEPDSPEDQTERFDDVEVQRTAQPQPDVKLPASVAGKPDAKPCSVNDELARASKVLAGATPAMRSMFQDIRLGKAIDTEHCLPLVNDITESVQRNPGAIVSLARLKTSDDYTYMHSVAVCALMVALAKQLGLNEVDTREAGMAGLVHDLGKALMPNEVLNKPGALTNEEFAIMKKHPEEGHRLLVEGRGVGPVPLDVCLHHHEKINGLGYPHKLKGVEISLYSKMGAVCDVYDAITSNRPYKAGWDPAESIQKMAHWAKEGHFDERIFQAFVKSIGIYPIGSLVKLKSGRLAVVMEPGSTSLVCPIVKVFFSTKSNEPIPHALVNLGDPKAHDQIVARENPATWGFPNLEALWSKPA
ncbi:MAG TPA: HD-GYP domain-containing protein [Aquabacterium sp.]|nr:HD-GYP domain-containing protein [Aquabacterium sp.]